MLNLLFVLLGAPKEETSVLPRLFNFVTNSLTRSTLAYPADSQCAPYNHASRVGQYICNGLLLKGVCLGEAWNSVVAAAPESISPATQTCIYMLIQDTAEQLTLFLVLFLHLEGDTATHSVLIIIIMCISSYPSCKGPFRLLKGRQIKSLLV